MSGQAGMENRSLFGMTLKKIESDDRRRKVKIGNILSIFLEVGTAIAVVSILFMGIIAATPVVMAVLGVAALAAAVAATRQRGLDFLSSSQYMHGLSFVVIAFAGPGNGIVAIGPARAVFCFSLSVGIAVSLLPVSRSLVETIVRLRRFPAWFQATGLYRVMDLSFGIAWGILLLIGAVLLYYGYETPVKILLGIAGIGSEFVVIALLQTHGYRYWNFLIGRARGEGS
jgi:hypothetical protein